MAFSKAHGLWVGAACIALFPAETVAQRADSTSKAQKVLTGKHPEKSGKKVGKAETASESGPQLTGESGRLEGDIIVTGLRENVKTARNAKRRAQQIVDVVVAQDIGKLPDKNVPEALARVPGVQVSSSIASAARAGRYAFAVSAA